MKAHTIAKPGKNKKENSSREDFKSDINKRTILRIDITENYLLLKWKY